MKLPMDGKWTRGTQLQSSGWPELMLPFVEGARGNAWLGQQALGMEIHEGEFYPPSWVGDWEEQRPRVMSWMARRGGWRWTVVAWDTQQGVGRQLKTGPHPNLL